MGILTDAFIATEAELAILGPDDHGPAAYFPTVQAKRVDPVKLTMLESTLTHRAPDELLESLDDNHVRDWVREWEDCWVYRFPEPLVSALLQVQPSDLPRIAAAWANTDEWRLNSSGPASREQIDAFARPIGDYCRLAHQAQRDGKQMFMWISL
jgi:hypothetical protein